MKTISEQWDSEIENLTKEVIASEKTYSALAKSDKFPKKRPRNPEFRSRL